MLQGTANSSWLTDTPLPSHHRSIPLSPTGAWMSVMAVTLVWDEKRVKDLAQAELRWATLAQFAQFNLALGSYHDK